MKNLFTGLFLFAALSVSAQEHFQDSIALARYKLQRTDMAVLAGWAGINMIEGSIAAANTTRSAHYFNQMNVYWNIANLAISRLGFMSAKKQFNAQHSLAGNLTEQKRMEKILLINMGLDVAYLTTGLYLKERGNRLDKDQAKGYGTSILLQGGFLMVFDIIQYSGHRRIGRRLGNQLQLEPTGNGLGIVYNPRY